MRRPLFSPSASSAATSSMSTAAPVTVMPRAINASFRLCAKNSVGLITATVRGVAAAPRGIIPEISSTGRSIRRTMLMPGRALPPAASIVVTRLTMVRPLPGASVTTAGSPVAAPGAMMRSDVFSSYCSAPIGAA